LVSGVLLQEFLKAPERGLQMTASLFIEEGVGATTGSKAQPPCGEHIYYKLAIVLAFAANLGLTNQEGRLDTDPEGPGNQQYLAPATYAFVIWAAIYLLELVFVIWQLVQVPGRAPERRIRTIQELCPGWVLGHTAQILWSFVFTKRFNTPEMFWFSAVMLAMIAAGLNFAHKAVAAGTEGTVEVWMMYAGITMHFGWTSAASLVNLNGWLVLLDSPPAFKMRFLVMSSLIAALLGVSVGVLRSSTLYAGVIAWAVIAVGVGSFTMEKLHNDFGVTAYAIGAAQIAGGLGILGWTFFANRKRSA